MSDNDLQAEIDRLKQDNMRLAEGNARYEKLRRLSPKAFSELHKACLKGNSFDKLLDNIQA